MGPSCLASQPGVALRVACGRRSLVASNQDSHPIPHLDPWPGPGPREARLLEVEGRAEMTGLYQSAPFPPPVVTSALERANSGSGSGRLG